MNLRFLSLFVNNLNDKSPKAKQSAGKAAGIIGILSNVILFIIKLIVGIACSSIAITADAINNISDAGSAVISLIGFKLSEKPADDEHPYGHARIEYLAGFIVSLIITVLGVQFFKDSIIAITDKARSAYSLAAIIILVISIIIKLWQASFYKAVGKHIGSSSLIATSADSRNDVISTSAVLVGAIISKFFDISLDGYLGVIIAVFIVYSGIRLIIETADPILGSAPDDELVCEISEKILSYEGILGIHDLIIHNYGEGRRFASVHCEVDANEDILKSHDIIDNIEFDFLRNKGIQLVIHMDPVVTDDERVNSLKKAVSEIIANLSCEIHEPISMHDFRVVFGQTHSNLLFDILINASCKADCKTICEKIEAEIKKLSSDYNAVINVDRNYTTVNAK
ncbi:MAG: cation transporter [Ruminococcaceae bacterium]|nr:cation transporter [Oscillospiraceae bacterium]